MKQMDILNVIGEAQEEYILDAAATRGMQRGKGSGRRALVVAIAAALAALLVGCGILAALNIQSLKLDDRQRQDSFWNWRTGSTEPVDQRVICYGGPQGTVQYRAAKEWYDFEIPYVQDAEWDEDFACPPEYEAYDPFDQTMVDKLAEITEKYGLKPIGAEIRGENEKGLLNYLGIEGILLPEAPARESQLRANYYESGKTSFHFQLQMEEGEDRWPYRTHVAWSLSPKDCFESGVVVLDKPETWEQWNYTTQAGQEFLILYTQDFWECYAIADRGDASIFLWMQSAKEVYMEGTHSEEMMSRAQVEQILDVIDFSVQPVPGDPALLSGLPRDHDPNQRVQTRDGYTVTLKSAATDGNKAWMVLGITVPEEMSLVSGTKKDGTKTFSVGFDKETIRWDGGKEGLFSTAGPEDDGDGRDNTVDYRLVWYDVEENAPDFTPDTRLSLTLEGMYRQQYNEEKRQRENLWRTEEVWYFEYFFDPECDLRKLEFLAEPGEIPAILGETEDGGEEWGTMTVESITLRTHSLELRIREELGYGQLDAWREEKTIHPAVVLNDGRKIPLYGESGFSFNEEDTYGQENWKPGEPVPLENVAYILLIDGTKLYPVE